MNTNTFPEAAMVAAQGGAELARSLVSVMKRAATPREERCRTALAKGKSPAALLVEAGPPDEWSGAVAAVLGKDARAQLTRLWSMLSPSDKGRVSDAFEKMFDAVDVVMDVEDAYGDAAKKWTTKKDNASAAVSGSVMVALFVPKDAAKRLAVEGGEPPDSLHVTLAYLGNAPDLPDDLDARLARAVASVASRHAPVTGKVNGVGVFAPGPTSDDKVPVWASFDAPSLGKLREDLVAALAEQGLETRSDHGFTPHITLAYGGNVIPDAPNFPMKVDRLTVAVGGEQTHFPLRAPSRKVFRGEGDVSVRNEGGAVVANVAGWDLEVGRREAPDPSLVSLALTGDRFTFPLDREFRASEHEPAGTSVGKVDVELGVQTRDFAEYFVSGKLCGTLVLKRGERGWTGTLSADAEPAVLSHEFPVPEQGSALPRSVEAVVPDDLRFWADGVPDRQAVRDSLASSRLLKSVRPVAGELRATVVKTFLVDKGDPPPHKPTTAAGAVSEILPAAKEYVHPFLEDDWRKAVEDALDEPGTFLLVSPTSSGHDPSEVAAALSRFGKADWLLEWDDTPDAVAALAKVGSPFRVPGSGRLFVASYPVANSRVEWVGKDEISKPFAGYADFDSCVAAQVASGKDDSSARRVCGALQRDLDKVLKRDIQILKRDEEDEEERYVLGVVLEPNDGTGETPLDPDSQADIYSEEDVRAAAHGWMEHHRNLGLQHQAFITGAAKVLESYLAPVDFDVQTAGGVEHVRKGTWLLAVRVVNDDLWHRVKTRELTGFSIGGSAVREPA